MKIFLCLIVIALSTYLGRLLSKAAVSRLDFFRQYHEAIISISDRISGMNMELFKALKVSGSPILTVFFEECVALLRESPHKKFSEIWTGCIDKSKLNFLRKEDIKVIKSGGEAIENLCSNPTEKQALAYMKRLSAYIEEMETEKRKKCKIYNTTGVLAGLFFALLMI